MKSEKEKMMAGEFYLSSDPELKAERLKASELFAAYNSTFPYEQEKGYTIIKELFGSIGNKFHVTPPFYCDYGFNINVGENFYTNHGCVILDVCPVNIGDNVMLGPGVHIYTATHPLNHEQRTQWIEMGKPVTIGNNVWIGGMAVICPGVTIADDAVIGAGSVVTKDVGKKCLVAGNPATLIRILD